MRMKEIPKYCTKLLAIRWHLTNRLDMIHVSNKLLKRGFRIKCELESDVKFQHTP